MAFAVNQPNSNNYHLKKVKKCQFSHLFQILISNSMRFFQQFRIVEEQTVLRPLKILMQCLNSKLRDCLLIGFDQHVFLNILERAYYEMRFSPINAENLMTHHNIQMEAQGEKKNSYLDEYKILKTLGAGYHAQVKLGQDQNGRLVAIKKYKKETATLETLKHELNIMKQLDHENLVKLISVRENATYKKKNEVTYACFAIVLEYVGGGELFDFVADTGKFSEKVARTYFHQMMNGLHYLHQKGYAHRDIKPENILLSQLYILKIADFGFSCQLKGKDNTGILHTKLGTEGYMAPEIANKKYEGKSCDIFASGVILFIMYAGNPPFEKATLNDPYYKLIKEKRFDIFWKAHSRKRPVNFFSDAFKDLFSRLIAFEPTQRLKIEEIANHPWVRDPICTHFEIKDEFTARQKKLDVVVEQRRQQQQKQKSQKLKAIQAQGSSSRGAQQVDNDFLEIYNKEFLGKRALPQLETLSKEDLILGQTPAFHISHAKTFFTHQQIKVADDQQELIGDETDLLKVAKIEDRSQNKINVLYQYSYEIEGDIFQDKVQVELTFGLTVDNKVLVHFERIEGNLLYYKKIVRDIKSRFLA